MAGLSEPTSAGVGALTAADVAAAARLSAGVGWNQDEADWARLVALHPEGAFAARQGGELVGTATLVRYGGALAWLGMVIVREDLRGQGLGGQLVDAALASWTPPAGAAVGLDATSLGAPLYRRKGFETVAHIDRWVGALRAPEAGGEAAGVAHEARGLQDGGEAPRRAVAARAAGPADVPALARLDAAATGVDREALLARLASEPGTAVCLVERDGEPVAHAALRTGRERLHVGPVVAADGTALHAVLAAVAERAAGREVFLDAVRSGARSRTLEAWGLRVARSLERMLRPAVPGRAMLDERVVAATGFEWG